MPSEPSTGRKLPRGGRVSSALAIRDEMLVEFPRRMPSEPAKVLARKIGATPRAIEGHRQGEHLPSLPVGIALGRRERPIREFLLRLMHAEMGDSGEDPSRVINESIEYLNALLREHQGKHGP